jgi:hypothetical protein
MIVDPTTNSSDTTTLGGFASTCCKWGNIAYADVTGKLYLAPQVRYSPTHDRKKTRAAIILRN